MKSYTDVSRKMVAEDRIAICPKFGCEFMKRVKPLKLRFFGFGKHPKCPKHQLHLVYVDEMIGDFIDAVLACFFDISALPPSELLEEIRARFPQEVESFVKGWVYCTTVGRGGQIASRYMDGISKGYVKELTRKQKKTLKKDDNEADKKVRNAVREGMNEVGNQYTRLLKHLRVHSEILTEPKNLESFSKSLRNYLNEWQKGILKSNKSLNTTEIKREMTLKEIKHDYDRILNMCTCRCLLGLAPESGEVKKVRISAFDRFSAYLEFHEEGLTTKFTKKDISNLINPRKSEVVLKHSTPINSVLNKKIISKYGSCYRIDHGYMLNLSKYIYLEIDKGEIFDFDNTLISSISKLKSDFRSQFWENKDFHAHITKYIRDLITIVKYFIDKSNSNNLNNINISLLTRNFIDRGINLNNKFDRLKQNLRDIFLHLREKIPEFKLKKIDKINLEKDEIGKTCGKCGKYKPYSQFLLRPDGKYKSFCRECYYEKGQIYLYKKKFRLIQEMQNGRFQGKCGNPDCGIDFRMLPAIEIHHPKNKSSTWRNILKQKYEVVKRILDDLDKTIPLCRNCHSLTYKVFYSYYRGLIDALYHLISYRFAYNDFKKEIKTRIMNYGLLDQYSYGITRNKIMAWLRKKIVINYIYNGECANCGEDDIGKLEFHHMNPTLKNSYKHRNPNLDKLNIWKTLTLSNTNEASERVICEECICLCANCHIMMTSNHFVDNSSEILSTPYYLEKDGEEVELILNGDLYSDEIRKSYDKLQYNCEKAHERIIKLKKSGESIKDIIF